MKGGITVGDQWSPLERHLHINVLELKAVELALKTLLRHRSVKSVHMRIDNTTALSYLVKKGGTKSPAMNRIAKMIWLFLMRKGVELSASWIPSKENVEADERSRQNPNSSDWLLHSGLFKIIEREFGVPSLDCFASRTMHQVQRYISLSPDPNCIAVNAMYQEWSQEFPIYSLLSA